MMNLQTPTWGVYAVSVSESVLLKLPFSFFPIDLINYTNKYKYLFWVPPVLGSFLDKGLPIDF